VEAPKTRRGVGVREKLDPGGMDRHVHHAGRLANRQPPEPWAKDGLEPADPAVEVRDLHRQPLQPDVLHGRQPRPPRWAAATARSTVAMER
jgi:hypothetical protein